MRFAELLFDVFDVLASFAEGGEPRVNIGDDADGGGRSAGIGLWGLAGFLAMPDDPDADGYAQVLTIHDGMQRRAIASRDNRYTSKAGELAPGDRACVSSSAARWFIKKAHHAIALFTENQKDGGAAQMLDLRGSTGVTLLLNGGCVIRQKTDELVFAINGGPSLTMNKDGFTFTGKQFAVACSTVTLGVMPGGVPPPPGVNSAIYGLSGQTGAPSTSVTIAP